MTYYFFILLQNTENGFEFRPQPARPFGQLQQKYAVMGQDMSSYLDGLLHADYLTYWDYIHLDTLLGLQNPKTRFPDEQGYYLSSDHRTLFFNLILWEIKANRFTSIPEQIFPGGKAGSHQPLFQTPF